MVATSCCRHSAIMRGVRRPVSGGSIRRGAEAPNVAERRTRQDYPTMGCIDGKLSQSLCAFVFQLIFMMHRDYKWLVSATDGSRGANALVVCMFPYCRKDTTIGFDRYGSAT